MIELGMFKEGHIDDEEIHFMLTDEVYENYLNLKRQQIEKEGNKDKLENGKESMNDEVRAIINTGKCILKK